MNEGLVSVMMPAYNAEDFIHQALESILAQTYPDWELIIVNDGSVDGTAEAICQYDDPRIKVITQENGGEGAARNTALEHISGEFLAFLDADDIFLPGHMQLAVEYLNAQPELDGVYTDGYHIDQAGGLLQTLSSRRRGPFVGDIFAELVRAPDVFGPPLCVILRTRQIYHRNLRFDAQTGDGTDWDFFIRFSSQARFGYLPEYTCYYRVHPNNLTLSIQPDQRKTSHAAYRIKAIRNSRFHQCPMAIRTAVFYELLVNLLQGSPAYQMEIIEFPEFKDLLLEEQARILRLMASKAILAGVEKKYIQTWLARSRSLNPTDPRLLMLYTLYKASPLASKVLLKLRTFNQSKQMKTSPFGKAGS